MNCIFTSIDKYYFEIARCIKGASKNILISAFTLDLHTILNKKTILCEVLENVMKKKKR